MAFVESEAALAEAVALVESGVVRGIALVDVELVTTAL